ncbi:hypothetical protein GDO86_010134 [Hymenochirus boettgeri]|uniref:Uncharacterized protein n=1 Tax=Hymenochirus boettgeri TaxID=247094 RepID=A0A8T2JS43_9PIPI|nr:hypothetical protein GDO86_010134 [Hymenochirus boettgeri]
MCEKINRTVFNEVACLKAIHEDLKTFKDELQEESPSLNAVIKEMIRSLKVEVNEEKNVKKGLCTSFNCKLKQCKVILFYHLRSVTISRVLNYLRSTNGKEHSTNFNK